ncbi:MAG: metallophosphoesterase [Clostridiales bacterium]|nr:metallophosphoesterase [Clostridiales bacterium]
MRTIIVGDIHGCFQELQALLKAVDFDQKTDCLISIGDLMDGG